MRRDSEAQSQDVFDYADAIDKVTVNADSLEIEFIGTKTIVKGVDDASTKAS